MRARRRLNNRGSALVTVMVVVTFLSILVTTLLYVSATNYKTKQVDYQNKISFYQCEQALDEIKALFVLEASQACAEAYKDTMRNYAALGAGDRYKYYKKVFVNELKEQWTKKETDPSASFEDFDVLQNHFKLSSSSVALLQSSALSWEWNEIEGFARIDNISVAVTVNNYTTMLTTSIYIKAPDINWNINDYEIYIGGTNDARKEIQMDEYVLYKNWSRY